MIPISSSTIKTFIPFDSLVWAFFLTKSHPNSKINDYFIFYLTKYNLMEFKMSIFINYILGGNLLSKLKHYLLHNTLQ